MEDLSRVAADDAVVDDRGVEGGQEQVGGGLHELEHNDGQRAPLVRGQQPRHQACQHRTSITSQAPGMGISLTAAPMPPRHCKPQSGVLRVMRRHAAHPPFLRHRERAPEREDRPVPARGIRRVQPRRVLGLELPASSSGRAARTGLSPVPRTHSSTGWAPGSSCRYVVSQASAAQPASSMICRYSAASPTTSSWRSTAGEPPGPGRGLRQLPHRGCGRGR